MTQPNAALNSRTNGYNLYEITDLHQKTISEMLSLYKEVFEQLSKLVEGLKR